MLQFYVHKVLMVIVPKTTNYFLIDDVRKIMTLLSLCFSQYQSKHELARHPLHLMDLKMHLRLKTFLKHQAVLGNQFYVLYQKVF